MEGNPFHYYISIMSIITEEVSAGSSWNTNFQESKGVSHQEWNPFGVDGVATSDENNGWTMVSDSNSLTTPSDSNIFVDSPNSAEMSFQQTAAFDAIPKTVGSKERRTSSKKPSKKHKPASQILRWTTALSEQGLKPSRQKKGRLSTETLWSIWQKEQGNLNENGGNFPCASPTPNPTPSGPIPHAIPSALGRSKEEEPCCLDPKESAWRASPRSCTFECLVSDRNCHPNLNCCLIRNVPLLDFDDFSHPTTALLGRSRSGCSTTNRHSVAMM